MSLEKLIEDYKSRFNVVFTDDGNKLFEWTENNLHIFTADKLENFLTIANDADDLFREEFIQKVEKELLRRKHLQDHLVTCPL